MKLMKVHLLCGFVWVGYSLGVVVDSSVMDIRRGTNRAGLRKMSQMMSIAALQLDLSDDEEEEEEDLFFPDVNSSADDLTEAPVSIECEGQTDFEECFADEAEYGACIDEACIPVVVQLRLVAALLGQEEESVESTSQGVSAGEEMNSTFDPEIQIVNDASYELDSKRITLHYPRTTMFTPFSVPIVDEPIFLASDDNADPNPYLNGSLGDLCREEEGFSTFIDPVTRNPYQELIPAYEEDEELEFIFFVPLGGCSVQRKLSTIGQSGFHPKAVVFHGPEVDHTTFRNLSSLLIPIFAISERDFQYVFDGVGQGTGFESLVYIGGNISHDHADEENDPPSGGFPFLGPEGAIIVSVGAAGVFSLLCLFDLMQRRPKGEEKLRKRRQHKLKKLLESEQLYREQERAADGGRGGRNRNHSSSFDMSFSADYTDISALSAEEMREIIMDQQIMLHRLSDEIIGKPDVGDSGDEESLPPVFHAAKPSHRERQPSFCMPPLGGPPGLGARPHVRFDFDHLNRLEESEEDREVEKLMTSIITPPHYRQAAQNRDSLKTAEL